MAELTKNRAPLPAGIPIDSRRVMSSADQQLIERAQAAIRQLSRTEAKLPALAGMMRDSQAGQPRAAATHREGDDVDGLAARRRRWCTSHERSLHLCEPDDLTCVVELDREVSDPTGQAAVGVDPAAAHHELLHQLLGRITSDTVRLLALLELYPAEAIEREQLGPDDEVGTTWCRSCWKDDKYCEPIPVRTSGRSVGKPYYPGLCRWCGRMRTELEFDPPTWMVELRHRGDVITPGMVEKAKANPPASTSKSKAKGKGKKRK